MRQRVYGNMGLVVGVALLLVACVASPEYLPSRSSRLRFDPDRVAVPSSLGKSILRLTGEKLSHASQPLSAVREQFPVPSFGDPQMTAGDPLLEDHEPPLTAQRAYVVGRDAWRRGENYQAISELQKALRLAPNEAHVLRLLGVIYTATGNRVRGAHYLKQAAALDPEDMDTIFLLARFDLDQNRWPGAIATFGLLADRIVKSQDAGSALEMLVCYYMAFALQKEGYTMAAVEQYQHYLTGARATGSTSRWWRELQFLDRQKAATWQAVGDLHHQLGNPGQAIRAYEHARQAGTTEAMQLLQRMLYSYLLLNQPDKATALVTAQIARSNGDAASLDLLDYLIEQGVIADNFQQQLRAIYHEASRPTVLALTIARLFTDEQASAWLRAHLETQPTDRRVLKQLLAMTLQVPQGQPVSQAAQIDAVRITARVMALAPHRAGHIARTLLNAVDDVAAIASVIPTMEASEEHRAIFNVIRGMALLGSSQYDSAVTALEEALDQNASLLVARLELASLRLVLQDVDHAQRLLEPLSESTDAQVIRLRARVLQADGQLREALALIMRMREAAELDGGRGGAADDVSLILEQADLQARLQDSVAAQQTLLDALNRQPRNEAIYAALFALYDGTSVSTGVYQRLMQRMLGEIPHSRIARLKRAEWYEAGSKPRQAEVLLVQLLEEDAEDMSAFKKLTVLYLRTDRKQEAIAGMEAKLEAFPRNGDLLLLASKVYAKVGDQDKRLEITERFWLLQPPGSDRVLALAKLYLYKNRDQEAINQLLDALSDQEVRQPVDLLGLLWPALLRLDRGDEAEQHLEAGMERFADHAADIGNEWASLIERRGDKGRAKAILLDVLKRDPNHAAANNNLAYAWTLQNRNLEEARAMLERVIAAEPNSAAYLDSMGWVLYKLGRFPEAIEFLNRSRAAPGGESPVILDHLADALYRADRHDEAARTWIKALSLFGPGLPPDDPDLVGLQERLGAKIKAVAGKQPPAVAALPEEVEGENAVEP